MGRHKRIDYSALEADLKAGKLTRPELMEKHKVSDTLIYKTRIRLGTPKLPSFRRTLRSARHEGTTYAETRVMACLRVIANGDRRSDSEIGRELHCSHELVGQMRAWAQVNIPDAISSLMLVARIREALGDHGRRTQPELIEYCRDLAAKHT
jgi:hypothetical protein